MQAICQKSSREQPSSRMEGTRKCPDRGRSDQCLLDFYILKTPNLVSPGVHLVTTTHSSFQA